MMPLNNPPFFMDISVTVSMVLQCKQFLTSILFSTCSLSRSILADGLFYLRLSGEINVT